MFRSRRRRAVADPTTGEFVWDAKGNRLINLKAGTNDTDAVNVGQMQAYVEEVGSGGVGVSPRIFYARSFQT